MSDEKKLHIFTYNVRKLMPILMIYNILQKLPLHLLFDGRANTSYDCTGEEGKELKFSNKKIINNNSNNDSCRNMD